ncbi:MAG: hypothetical protein CMC82_01825 [Flavobacteriaceae bacterium]|nr:hypothetical protein [Flavobacteriaceae bacterium]
MTRLFVLQLSHKSSSGHDFEKLQSNAYHADFLWWRAVFVIADLIFGTPAIPVDAYICERASVAIHLAGGRQILLYLTS